MKVYYWMFNVGKSRYSINFHNGNSTHRDGSPFFDLRIFSNRRKAEAFVKSLERDGYTEREWDWREKWAKRQEVTMTSRL